MTHFIASILRATLCAVFAIALSGVPLRAESNEETAATVVEAAELDDRSLESQLLAGSRRSVEKVIVETDEPTMLTNVPLWVCYVRDLEHLVIKENQINQLPDCLKNHAGTLRILEIEKNEIDNLGPLSTILPNLEMLELTDVRLNDGFTFAYSPTIEFLTIDGAEFAATSPLNIHNNPRLETLKIENSVVQGLDRNIGFLGNLPNLTTLSLRGNNLTLEPAGLAFLPKLRTLDAGGNNFSAITRDRITSTLLASPTVVVSF